MGTRPHAYVTGLGVVCAGAGNVAELRKLLAQPSPSFRTPTVFPAKGACATLPVAESVIPADVPSGLPSDLPRTHRLAIAAAREALGTGPAPDAIVLGTTTGGILVTEAGLESGVADPAAYRLHALDTVASTLADVFAVRGPVITLSTACSSAAVALSTARALLRAGLARRALVGGADSLCRLTFHGFRQLQLVDAQGARPLDAGRAGMTVGEGAAFLVLESDPHDRRVLATLAGTGLSCDAYHATSPHPEGAGAALAMRRALADAGLEPSAIDYVNLHGTGTVDNDAAEARALAQVFGPTLPALSSTKGLTGHALAAAGAVEAVIAVLALSDQLLPANTGLDAVDPKLGLDPVRAPTKAKVDAVLSSSFGFGGNNACVVLHKPPLRSTSKHADTLRLPTLRIAGSACLSARGDEVASWEALLRGEPVAGFVPDAAFNQVVPAAFVRRLKRLPRMSLALARTALDASQIGMPPAFIAFGTAWGPLAETQDFLRKLFESNDQFSSPMDFIGSVHNAPAGQVALLLGAQSPNLTFSSSDRSFSQTLLGASMAVAAGAPHALVLAAEAFEPHLSPLFEPAVARGALASDGGGAVLLVPDDDRPGARVRWLGERGIGQGAVLDLVDELAHEEALDRFDAVLVGVPAALDDAATESLAHLTSRFPRAPIVGYRARLGQHASVTATAVVLLARAVVAGTLPFATSPAPLPGKRVLVLDLGHHASAVEVFA
jgi:3-oxoacyl-(acyl-carrier-protein) synthase